MNLRLALCAAFVLAACSSSTDLTPITVTGSWAGSWSVTPAGPVEEWTGAISQSGSAVTGNILCAFSESYAVSGTNTGNKLSLMLVGVSGDTAHFNGTVTAPAGVVASGQFTGGAGGCFAGAGTWSGELL